MGVHCDHASILHRYGDMALQILDAHMDARTLRQFCTLSNVMHCIGQKRELKKQLMSLTCMLTKFPFT